MSISPASGSFSPGSTVTVVFKITSNTSIGQEYGLHYTIYTSSKIIKENDVTVIVSPYGTNTYTETFTMPSETGVYQGLL
ncbi:MAG: hypothetical protein QXM03_12590 [Metallosphaera sp.]|uniref:hypothetical protein n=1 Tax=Metallosphaera sp. TaxID=2020860 RepID=UPI003167AE21